MGPFGAEYANIILKGEMKWLNEEYKRITGEESMIQAGVPNSHVEQVKMTIFRHYIEEMKKVITDAKSDLE